MFIVLPVHVRRQLIIVDTRFSFAERQNTHFGT